LATAGEQSISEPVGAAQRCAPVTASKAYRLPSREPTKTVPPSIAGDERSIAEPVVAVQTSAPVVASKA
jgi:hypothetical protein